MGGLRGTCMRSLIGIRRENKNKWERRVPLIPEHLKKLREKQGVTSIVQPSQIRAFLDKKFSEAGATVQNDLLACPIVFAVKEIPIDFFEPGKTYVFFSHTIKGQKHNMPMLKRMMDLGCTLIDYEKIVDNQGRRLLFFGRFAGLAGMVDTLWAFGQRLQWENIDTPFNDIKQTIQYKDLEDIKEQVARIGKKIAAHGLPQSLTPLIVGFAGYGNVYKGTQEIIDLLPVQELAPHEIESVFKNPSHNSVYKVVFKEKHMVEPISSDDTFDLQEYYQHPENYRSVFEAYLPHLTILMNCIYWDKQYPRLVTKAYLKQSFAQKNRLRLRVIGDISCDINGAIECTEKETTPDNPVFVYHPLSDEITDGYAGDGVVIMAVDNLPCELPRESSQAFSTTLSRFIPDLANADFSEENFDALQLPPEIKNAIIVYHGKLTPNYQYIAKYL